MVEAKAYTLTALLGLKSTLNCLNQSIKFLLLSKVAQTFSHRHLAVGM